MAGHLQTMVLLKMRKNRERIDRLCHFYLGSTIFEKTVALKELFNHIHHGRSTNGFNVQLSDFVFCFLLDTNTQMCDFQCYRTKYWMHNSAWQG